MARASNPRLLGLAGGTLGGGFGLADPSASQQEPTALILQLLKKLQEGQ